MLQIASPVVTAGDKLVHNQARIDLLQLEQSRLAAEFAAGEEWDRDGFNSPYDWIRVKCQSPASSDGARGRLAADQNRRRSDHHRRADGYVRFAERVGLNRSTAFRTDRLEAIAR